MPPSPRPDDVVPAEPPRFPPEHFDWLKGLSVAVHRRAAYPPSHPSRIAAEQGALAALERVLAGRPPLTVMVVRQTLGIDGVTSDPRHPVLSDLADRLQRAGVGALTMGSGVTAAELEALLEMLLPARQPRFALGTEPSTEPLSTPSLDHVKRDPGPHIRVDWVSFDGLVLAGDESDPSDPADADRLWRALAAVALFGEGDNPAELLQGDPARLATALADAAADPAKAAELTRAVLDVARIVRRHGRESGAVMARLRALLASLPPDFFLTLLQGHADPEQRRRAIQQGIDALPVSAVLDWVQAAAQANGKSLSPHLLRLMGKLGQQTRRRPDRSADDDAIRDAARALVDGWSLDDASPPEHAAILDRIARFDGGDRRGTGSALAGAERVLQTALELDVVGPDVLKALEYLIEHDRLALVVSLLERAPHAPDTVAEMEQALVAPALLRRVLLADSADPEVVRACLERCGPPEVRPLLDVLALSEAQATRLLVLERLRGFGESVRPAVVERLADAGPYLLRNLLSLLVQLPEPPVGIALGPFLTHDEPLVRAEAVRALARVPGELEAALAAGLADRDVRVQRAALDIAGTHGMRRTAIPRLLALLDESAEGGELRLRGIPLLAQAPTPAARDWLLGLVLVRRGFLVWKRWRLAPRSPQTLAALRGLAQGWSADPEARRALDLAVASDDAGVKAAAGGRGVP